MTEWKLVPVEPTEEMIDSLRDYHGSESPRYSISTYLSDDYLAAEAWRDAVAAAPEPPADERDAEIERLRELLNSALNDGFDMCKADYREQFAEYEAEIARLREALGRYGTHEYDDEGNPCRGGEFTRALDADGQPEFYDCTCGFNDALREGGG
jgi:hypothetical protein